MNLSMTKAKWAGKKTKASINSVRGEEEKTGEIKSQMQLRGWIKLNMQEKE